MRRKQQITLVLLVLTVGAALVQASGSAQYLANGFEALFYHSIRLEESFPRLNPLGLAVEEFAKAARDEESAGEANLMLGLIYKHLDRPGTALGYFLDFAQLHPEELWVQALIGELYLEMGRLPEAERSFKLALAGDTEEETLARAQVGLGHVAFGRGQYLEAKEAYTKALEQAGDFLDARLGLGKTLYHLGEYHEAIETLEIAQLQAPRSLTMLQYLGLSYEAAGLEEKAAHTFTRLAELQRTN